MATYKRQKEVSEGEDRTEANEPPPSRPKRRRVLMICGHCDRSLPKLTYYRHREAFFNPVSGVWMRQVIDEATQSKQQSDNPCSSDMGCYESNNDII